MGRDASRRALTPALLVSLLAGAAAGPRAASPHAAPPLPPRSTVVFSGPAMGSRYTVRVVMRPGDDAAKGRVRAAIEAELDRVDRLFSRWRPESEVSRLGAHASTEPFPISADRGPS